MKENAENGALVMKTERWIDRGNVVRYVRTNSVGTVEISRSERFEFRLCVSCATWQQMLGRGLYTRAGQ